MKSLVLKAGPGGAGQPTRKKGNQDGARNPWPNQRMLQAVTKCTLSMRTTEQLEALSYTNNVYSQSASCYPGNAEAKFSTKRLQIAGTSVETASAC